MRNWEAIPAEAAPAFWRLQTMPVDALMVWFHNGAKSADNCVAQNGQLGEVATAVVLYVWQRLRASLYQGGVTKLFR